MRADKVPQELSDPSATGSYYAVRGAGPTWRWTGRRRSHSQG